MMSTDEWLPTVLGIAMKGTNLPAEVGRPYVDSGFRWRTGTLEDFESKSPDNRDPIFLLWVGDDWDSGLRCVEELPEEQRHRTVLTGRRKPGSRLIRAAIHIGALAVAAHPVPDWFMAPFKDAVLRGWHSFQRQLLRAVKELQGQLEHSPPLLLIQAAKIAGEILAADMAVATLKDLEGDHFKVLVRKPDGRIVGEAWEQDPQRRKAPSGISRFVLEHKEITIIPEVLHSELCKPGGGDEIYRAALVQPLHIPEIGIGGHQRPMLASLNLYWLKPYFPTPNEILVFEVLTALATSSLARLLEHARFSNIHSIARSVLTQPSDFHAKQLKTETLSEELSEDLNEDADSLEKFIRLMIRAYSGRLGLRELWVRRPPRAPDLESGPWIFLGESANGGRPPDRERPSGNEIEVVDVVGRGSLWAAQKLFKAGSPHLGELIAVFSSQGAAWAAATEIERLADDIFTAICLHRRAKNTESLLKLSTVPARPEEAQSDLRRIVKAVQARTHSFGAKVFVVLRAVQGPKIWQMYNTDFPEAAPEPQSFRAERGLADWVLQNDKWLLIPQMQPSEKTGKEQETCITKGGHEVRVLARSEKDHWPEHASPDEEQTMLFVPLHTGAQVTGVLSVWREEKIPYDPEFDTETLLYFAPHVASACQRMLQLDKAREELDSISRLTHRLRSAATLSQAYDAVTEGVGTLADAACAILLHFDEDKRRRRRHLYKSSFWSANESRREEIAKCLERLKLACDEDSEIWELEVEEALKKRKTGLDYRGLLLPSTPSGVMPPLAVALLDPPRPRDEPRFFSDDLLDHYANSFLQSATAMLSDQAAALASRLIDKIGRFPENDDQGAEEVLADSAKLLKTAVDADAALIYTGTPRQMKVRSTWPERRDRSKIFVKEKSSTYKSLKQRRPIRFLDVPLSEDEMDPDNLKRLARAFRWNGVGSWLCCSVRYNDRSIGLIKILTRRNGPFLGKDHEKVVSMIADRTAAEMYKADRRDTLTKLLHLSNELSGLLGENLEQQMAEKLKQEWVVEMMHRRKCRVVVVAHSLHGKRLALSGSKDTAESLLARLEELSLVGTESSEVIQKTPVRRVFRLKSPKGIMTSISLPGEERLKGHLFLLDDEDFGKDEMEALPDAAHYMAVVLNGRRERVGWRETMGKFRHAVLSPVQGVGEVAMMLAEHSAQGTGSSKEITELRGMLEEELETVRLWRENGRFYLADRTELQLIKQALKPLVERIAKRFGTMTKERGILLKLKWNIGGELQFIFDKEALDLAISNLLDNAHKYAFFNREITLGVDLNQSKEVVEIWVEDIGHKIPKSVEEEIYVAGKRGAPHDPFRTILGQGLGLAMVLELVKAHDGELKHTSEQLAPGEVTEKTPFRVRFTMEIPYRRLS